MSIGAAENAAVIGSSVKLRGELSGAENLQFNGEIEGSIRLGDSRLTIGDQARVRADLVAKEVVVLGRVHGDIYASGRADLRSTAVVEGNVYAATLSVEDGAFIQGKVDPERATQAPPPATSGKA